MKDKLASNKKEFLKEYISQYIELLQNFEVSEQIIKAHSEIIKANNNGNKIVFAGNGASAAIASHAALDFKKQAGINTLSFNDTALITAFSNDFGYERWVEKAIEYYCKKGDIAILISSSGKSLNIINAAKYSKQNKIFVISFSGFEEDNLLQQYGDISFWVKSKAYNIIENIHQIWLMIICDLIIGEMEYQVN